MGFLPGRSKIRLLQFYDEDIIYSVRDANQHQRHNVGIDSSVPKEATEVWIEVPGAFLNRREGTQVPWLHGI